MSLTKARWNPLAIVSFVVTFILPPVAIVLGAVALSQTRRTGQRGHDLALAAIIVSVIFIAIGVWATITYRVS